MKKIVFILISVVLISHFSCRKKSVEETVTVAQSIESAASVSPDITYQGVYFIPGNWEVDTMKVDDGAYKILMTLSYGDSKITMNIHDMLLNPSNYMQSLKMQITNSSKTQNAEFTDIVQENVDGVQIYTTSFVGGELTTYKEPIKGVIKVYIDKTKKRTYGLLAMGEEYVFEQEIFSTTFNSIKLQKTH